MGHGMAFANSHRNLQKMVYTGICLVISLTALAGCSRNPQVRKAKAFDRGNAYFKAGQYREAAIEYANAVQIDPRYTDAHFQLAQTFLKESQFNSAYVELQRTVDLAPDNKKAQLDLAALLVAGGKPTDARDHAEAVFENRSAKRRSAGDSLQHLCGGRFAQSRR